MAKQPMQPIVWVGDVIRFQQNKLVTYLLDHGGLDMNDLALVEGVTRADREQFAQLIGYSVSGFGELGYVRKKTLRKADERADMLRSAPPPKPQETP